ncbi:MAG: hypothetical protein FWC80_01355 [Firmicutes bacterium]|nr:hypothetical protein [Bacillota bacterium]
MSNKPNKKPKTAKELSESLIASQDVITTAINLCDLLSSYAFCMCHERQNTKGIVEKTVNIAELLSTILKPVEFAISDAESSIEDIIQGAEAK